MNIKKCLTILLGLSTAVTIHAQDLKHYFSVIAGGGMHSLKYDIPNGDVKSGPGGTFNLGYSYFLNPNLGFGTGIGLQSALTTGTLNYTAEYDATDADGDNFILRLKLNDWKEKQKALFLDIPVGVQYQRWCNEKNGFLAFAGAKVSIPLSQNYKVTSGSITTTGYYPQWNVELSDMPQHGFTTVTERPSGDLDLKTSTSLFAELGWLYNLSEKLDLYAGGYIHYGLNNIVSAGKMSSYLDSETYTSMITSTDKASLLTFGIKVGVRMHAPRNRKVEETPVAEPMPAPVIAEEPKPEPAPVVKEEPKPEPEPVVVPEPVPDPYVVARKMADTIQIRFLLNTASPINDVYDNQFRELAEVLKANPGMKVRIQGHTCNLASREVNLKIGMQRAEVGKEKLMKYGVPASQIVTESKAFDEPLVPNTSEENRMQNRRIKLIVE